jgi:protein TonB
VKNFHSIVGSVHGGGAGRDLSRALLLSLALHGLVLWPALLPRAPQPAAQPLAATLRAAVLADRASAADAPPAAPAPQPQRSTDKPHQVREDKPAAMARPVAQQEPSVEAARGVDAAPATGLTAQGTLPVASPRTEALAAAAEGVDGDALRAYRIGLARGARAHKRYPGIAQERGWAGTAEVRVAISREGRPSRILLAHSSGHEVLDRMAVDMMTRAAAAAAVPELLRGREFAVSLPVVFDLAE